MSSVVCLGPLDVQNPAAISKAQMNAWSAEGTVRYLGVSDDVRVHLVDADCVVLPSYYREGVPRGLLEAAAMGRAIIASDSTGCRETVEHGVTGLLCRPRDVSDLVEKMEQMLAMNPEARADMGRRGRAKVEREFDERIVIQKYLDAIREILDSGAGTTDG
jgi:glycosyltransferase involved in cell wall biosynthesis